ncbi:hypothetical protein ACFQ4C_05360 [Larkinella insperata]|uniref:Adhesin n=1 Tax=Larkinella insperata TaxID=332158 RepID=A0ABW3Q130_9BACT|nr:hypothetical protein [Larkinella insperata]
MPTTADMDPNGTAATDLDFSTTATTRNQEQSGASYPGEMSSSGYGGSASMPTGPDDDEEYDEEDLTIDEDDEELDEDLDENDDDDEL